MITALIVAVVLWLTALVVVAIAGATPSINVERAFSSTEQIVRLQDFAGAQQGVRHAA